MTFVTGSLLIDAPASALNNLGGIPGERDENTVGVKLIRSGGRAYPYVSAQAFRYWLRETISQRYPEWKAAPMFREKKVAYTDANPILYWDDDLFGYMRAPSTKADAVKARESDESRANETPTAETVTRVSPFRMSTLVSIAPVIITEDFGVMSRHEGDPVPHVHQFYRTTLQGLFSLDLHASGTFSYRAKTGYLNLDDVRIQQAQERGLIHREAEKAYRLPPQERIDRVAVLLASIAQLEGGAKLTLHYTDVAPRVTLCAITAGGNHLFGHVFAADNREKPSLNLDALSEALTVFHGEILSPIYVGWVEGYEADERAKLEAFAAEAPNGHRFILEHPRRAFEALVEDLRNPENAYWLD